jgi:hypothetical protein
MIPNFLIGNSKFKMFATLTGAVVGQKNIKNLFNGTMFTEIA